MQRAKFQSIIEDAIQGARLSAAEADALRAVGRKAASTVVGDFDGCPADQAGIYEPPAGPQLWAFARRFDAAMGGGTGERVWIED